MASKWIKSFIDPHVKAAPEDVNTQEKAEVDSAAKQPTANAEAITSVNDDGESAVPDPKLTEGVQKMEAITQVWTRVSLIVLFVSIWLMYLMNAFQANITGNLAPFVTSAFESHSLIPVIYIVSNIMAGALRLAVCRMLDLWGRPQGYAVMVTIATLGLIMMATSKNVQTFAAAQVFYQVGFDGIIYTADVTTADITTLKNRGLAYAFTASPWIITAYAGPTAAESFYEDINWQWGFGTFCILVPVVAIPFVGTLLHAQRKAKHRGLLVNIVDSGRNIFESIRHYIIEFDVLGVFLFAAGFSLFLLPFSLANSAAEQWRSAHIIAMLVVGILTIIAFALVERFVSPRPFVRFDLLASRTILGTLLLAATYQVSYYCWASYFTSFLQVVLNLSVAKAGYVASAWDVTSGVWCFVVGYLIHKTARFKWLMMIAVPLEVLFQGLLIYFRRPDTHVGYIVMCQVFMAISGGTLIMTEQVSIMSTAKHQDVAATLALLGLAGYLGGAIGNTISGAIWTNVMPAALARYLPADALPMLEDIYNDIETQLSFEVGSPTRDGIIAAYGDAQRYMVIAATALMALAFFWVVMIKNVNLAENKQVKGVVFGK